MCGEKRQQLISSILDMTDKEADIFAIFLDGFRAGKQTVEQELAGQIKRKQFRSQIEMEAK